VKHQTAKRMVFYAVIGTMVAMVFMGSTIVFPHPLLLVMAMSVGQGIAIFSLALYLLAVALDLQSQGGAYIPYEEPAAVEEAAPAEEPAPVEGGAAATPVRKE
jgi:hypothetical protein